MREFYSIFFLSVFLAFIATPTVIAYFDNGIDVSYIYSTTEEEQNGDERNFNEKHNKLINNFHFTSLSLIELNKKKTIETPELKWSTVYSELHSPPPEYI